MSSYRGPRQRSTPPPLSHGIPSPHHGDTAVSATITTGAVAATVIGFIIVKGAAK